MPVRAPGTVGGCVCAVAACLLCLTGPPGCIAAVIALILLVRARSAVRAGQGAYRFGVTGWASVILACLSLLVSVPITAIVVIVVIALAAASGAPPAPTGPLI
jgi:hypothetical protein